MIIQKERLLILAQALEDNANNPTGMKFDLGMWARTAVPVGAEPATVLPKQNCGTTGCAVGLAGMLPEFNALGFSLEHIYSAAPFETNLSPVYMTDDFRHTKWDAVRMFFGLDRKQSDRLFITDSYWEDGLPTKGAEAELLVAKRIRDLVATEG